MNGEGGDGGGGAGGGEEDPSRLRVEKVGISALPKDITRRLPEWRVETGGGRVGDEEVLEVVAEEDLPQPEQPGW